MRVRCAGRRGIGLEAWDAGRMQCRILESGGLYGRRWDSPVLGGCLGLRGLRHALWDDIRT